MNKVNLFINVFSYLCLLIAILHIPLILKKKKYGIWGVLLYTYSFLIFRFLIAVESTNKLIVKVMNLSSSTHISNKNIIIGIFMAILIIYFSLFIFYFVSFEKERKKSNLKWWETIFRLP